MALYEITFLTKEETDPGVRQAIEALGASVSDESSLGRRRLAYPIKKETQAVYTTYVFEAEAGQLPELNRRLRLNGAVLRYLIVQKPTERVDKEVTKTVREAIAAAEKLGEMPTDEPTAVVEASESDAAIAAATADVAAADVSQAVEVISQDEPVATTEAETTEEVVAPKAKTARAKKSAMADAAEATEEDRLKALEDKLGEILKD